jgi:hypothetical protein
MDDILKRSPFLDSLQAPAQASGEPAWLRERRASAAVYLQGASLPGFRDEDWKYTNLGILGQQRFDPAAFVSQPSIGATAEFIAPDEITVGSRSFPASAS